MAAIIKSAEQRAEFNEGRNDVGGDHERGARYRAPGDCHVSSVEGWVHAPYRRGDPHPALQQHTRSQHHALILNVVHVDIIGPSLVSGN